MSAQIPFSVLDLAVIRDGHDAADAFERSRLLAQHSEAAGYKRFWLAEHHNMAGIGSSATSVLIGHIAAGTKSIRVGSGGVMMPNHSAFAVAEQFGTLASLYPGRIDLGLGRAPGTDQRTAFALRRGRTESVQDFPQDILALQNYFSKENSTAIVRAIPGEGLDIPLYILGSSMSSAQLAAALGLPYAFASHFAPAEFLTAIKFYRQNFRPSAQCKLPYVISCVNIIAAETNAEAEFLCSSMLKMILGITKGKSIPLPPPSENADALFTPLEKYAMNERMLYSFIGDKKTVADLLKRFISDTKIDELMITTNVFDHAKRLHSYEIVAEILSA